LFFPLRYFAPAPALRHLVRPLCVPLWLARGSFHPSPPPPLLQLSQSFGIFKTFPRATGFLLRCLGWSFIPFMVVSRLMYPYYLIPDVYPLVFCLSSLRMVLVGFFPLYVFGAVHPPLPPLSGVRVHGSYECFSRQGSWRFL